MQGRCRELLGPRSGNTTTDEEAAPRSLRSAGVLRILLVRRRLSVQAWAPECNPTRPEPARLLAVPGNYQIAPRVPLRRVHFGSVSPRATSGLAISCRFMPTPTLVSFSDHER
jgi:hypothetical protein